MTRKEKREKRRLNEWFWGKRRRPSNRKGRKRAALRWKHGEPPF